MYRMRKQIDRFAKGLSDFFSILAFCIEISYKASPRYFLTRVFFLIALTVLPFFNIYISKIMINALFEGAVGAVPLDIFTVSFINLIILVVSLTLSTKLAERVGYYYQGLHLELVLMRTQYQLMEKTAALDLRFFDSSDFYNEMSDARNNISLIGQAAFEMLGLLRGCLQFLIAFIYLFQYSPLMGVLLVLSFIPSLIIENKQVEAVYRYQREHLLQQRKMNYTMDLTISRLFAKDIRFYNLFSFVSEKYKAAWNMLFTIKRNIATKYTRLLSILAFLPEAVKVFFFIKMGLDVFHGSILIGDFTYYQDIIFQTIAGLYLVLYNISRLNDGKIRIKNYMRFMNFESELKDAGTQGVPEGLITIEFRDVYFRYNETTPYILNGLSFAIDSNKMAALVGVNGAGKSTIVKLLLRFYDPTKGAILINGEDIKAYSLESLRECFSVMFQDYNNYAFTVRESVGLSNTNEMSNSELVKESLAESGADAFTSRYPEGIETYLTRQYDEDGEELSGGQWQAVALARTFFRKARFYILDEPSAALDAEAEDKLFKQFEALYKDKGALLISHRLSNIASADIILVIENGRLIEQGTHRELMHEDGRYAQLYHLQAEKYAVDA